MNRVLQLLFAIGLLTVLPLAARAQFTTSISNGAVTITGYTGSGGAVSIPSTINSLPVIGIAANAFAGKSSLTSVSISAGVGSVAGGAFANCQNLTAINVASSNTALSSVGGVLFDLGQTTLIQFPGAVSGSYTVPSSVTTIAANAFATCNSLTGVTIPTSVTSIGAGAFATCPKLAAITVTHGNTAYSSVAGVLFDLAQATLIQYPGTLAGSYAVPASVTTVADNAFESCAGLTGVVIPASVTTIGTDAFDNCSGLTSVSLGSGVTNIGFGAFAACSSLTSITIPGSVTSLGAGAFASCTSLVSISIPSSVTSIGSSTFFDCTSLTSITIPASVTNIGFGAFQNCISLTAFGFLGNPPSTSGTVFDSSDGATVYHLAGATGWTSTFGGLPTAVMSVPGITGPPASEAVVAGTTASFTVAASGSPAPAVQWQVSTDGGNTFTNVSGSHFAGYNSGTLTITAPTTAQLGEQFQAVLTSPAGTVATVPVHLVVGTSTAQLNWLQSNFTTAQLGNPSVVGDLATPANDGVANLVKYAFNLGPLANAEGALPTPTLVNGLPSLVFDASQSDLTYTVQASTDLVNWSTANVTTVTNCTQVTASYNQAGVTPVFLQIVIAPAP